MAFRSRVWYDANEQQNKIIRHQKSTLESDGEKKGISINLPIIILNFSLSILAKDIDALQIVEQILPYFQPEYTV